MRLAPARLSHCMRWLGSANRAQDIATDYARTREAFGKKLGEHEGVSFMLADNAMDIHLARLAIWHTAWVLDQGHRASNESSMSKVICSEAIARVADRSLQILGGMGITRDTVVERIFRDTRAFRIYDGPSEVHRWALGARCDAVPGHQSLSYARLRRLNLVRAVLTQSEPGTASVPAIAPEHVSPKPAASPAR